MTSGLQFPESAGRLGSARRARFPRSVHLPGLAALPGARYTLIAVSAVAIIAVPGLVTTGHSGLIATV
jgi:hypothetical protein